MTEYYDLMFDINSGLYRGWRSSNNRVAGNLYPLTNAWHGAESMGVVVYTKIESQFYDYIVDHYLNELYACFDNALEINNWDTAAAEELTRRVSNIIDGITDEEYVTWKLTHG